MGKSKRKSDGSSPGLPTKSAKLICVLHNPSVASETDTFTSFQSAKQASPNEKLSFLLQIRGRRLAEPPSSSYRMTNVCNLLPETLDGLDLDTTGYHRRCYQNFTANLTRLHNPNAEPSTSRARSPRRRRSGDVHHSQLLFDTECIFCDKTEIRKKKGTERTVKFQSWKNKDSAWQSIEDRAAKLGKVSLTRKVKGEDLFARGARYHESCWNYFNTEYANHLRATDRREVLSYRTNVCNAHAFAYDVVKQRVIDDVLVGKKVVELTSLYQLYVQHLESSGFPFDGSRPSRLLDKLENDDAVAISVCGVPLKASSPRVLVYNTGTKMDEAIISAFKLAADDHLQYVAANLRDSVIDAFQKTPVLPWPPTADELENSPLDFLPKEITRFLMLVISGDECSQNERSNRIVTSIAQDICRAVTNGEWKLPKHILLCATVRRLYRSKQLTSILNRLGHSESYTFGLELETAIARAVDDVSTFLTPTIVTGDANLVFHSEWDNLNKITTNVQGSNVVNSAGGIMIQETSAESVIPVGKRCLPTYTREKTERMQLGTPESLAPLNITVRTGPRFPDDASFSHPIENSQVLHDSMKAYYTWILCRAISSEGRQQVPGLGGFISSTGKPSKKKSTVEFYTPINQPITQYEVVEELFRRSEEATAEVGQQYTINTFDLGVVMKALPLLWKFPDRYPNHIVLIGQFHTVMNYMGMVTGHKCRGSGYAEILLEAQLVTNGCLKSVLNGKAYAKALFCMKTVCEALERLLLTSFIEEDDAEISPESLLSLINSCDDNQLDKTLRDESTTRVLEQYEDYQQKVRQGHLGKTARFWLSVMDHCRLVFMMLFAVKTNNLELFHKCNADMAPLFFAFDGQNYSRYLTWFDAYLTNIELIHPGGRMLIRQGAIAVARSFIPGSLNAVDKTMEETFMRFAKTSGGLLGIFNNYAAYQRWCRTTSCRAQYVEKLLEYCGMIDDPECPKGGIHREVHPAEIRKSEEAVLRTITAIQNFTNPFKINDKERLYSLASGAPVSSEAEADILNAEAIGKATRDTFISERLQHSEKSFFDPIKRLNLKTMEVCNKTVKLTTSAGKLIQYQEQSNLAFQLLVKSQLLDQPVDLDELMRYPLAPIPHALGTPHGFLAKTNKATMMHYLLDDNNETDYPRDAVFIQDGNALYHALTNLPTTFGETCLKVLDQMVTKKQFIFSTDTYHHDSIKAQERLRRGVSDKFIIDGPATRMPKDFKLFLCNDANKTQFSQLMLKVWSSKDAVSRLKKCSSVALVVGGKVYTLQCTDEQVKVTEVPELASSQEETDTRVVLYLRYAATQGHTAAVVRSPDTDVFFILLHHANNIELTIILDTGVGKSRRLVNVTQLAEELGGDYCSSLLGLYVFTGEDCTSAFRGKGKVAPLKKLQRYPKYQPTFRKLGENWLVTEELNSQLESFTCAMYSYERDSSVNVVRCKLLKKMVGEEETLSSKSKVDFTRLPPCRDSLIPHIQRVNHRIACYKRASEPIPSLNKPDDADQGWQKSDEGILEPIWSTCPILPASLVDLLATAYVDGESDNEDDGEIEYEFEDPEEEAEI